MSIKEYYQAIKLAITNRAKLQELNDQLEFYMQEKERVVFSQTEKYTEYLAHLFRSTLTTDFYTKEDIHKFEEDYFDKIFEARSTCEFNTITFSDGCLSSNPLVLKCYGICKKDEE